MKKSKRLKQRMELREKEIYKVTLMGSGINAVLIVLKFIAGFVGKSSALVADAVHSLSDFISDVIVFIFVKIAGKPKDKGHDYGHGKFETLATVIIGVLLILAGIGLMINGIETVMRSINGEKLERLTMLALIVALVTIVTSVPGIQYIHNLRTRQIGNKIAVDLHAKMDGGLSLTEAHEKATAAENVIKRTFGENSIINIHMEPISDSIKFNHDNGNPEIKS